MERDIKIINKKELRRISSDFRMYADYLMRTTETKGMQNLKRFVNFIDQTLVISSFLQNKRRESNFQLVSFDSLDIDELYHESLEDEISFIHQLLQYGVEKFSGKDDSYWRLIHKAGCAVRPNFQAGINEFNSRIIEPFVCYIELHLTHLQADLGDDENAKLIFHLYGDNYGTNLGATMNEMSIDQSNSSIGVGVNHGEINTKKLAGTINEAEKQNLAEAVAEIRQLLEQLSQTYPTHTTVQNMVVAEQAIGRIENDPTWKQRAINALKEGGPTAFKKAIDNPAGGFIVEAIKLWQEAEVQ
jgi:hypothetical protein